MKVGFTPREVYTIYRSLSKEVFNYFDYQYEKPVFRTRTMARHENSIAQTDFGVWAWLENSPAQLVEFNRIYFPHLYEDELIGTILHELAHVVAGFRAGHTELWSDKAAEVGGHAHPVMVPRNWRNLPLEYQPSVHTLASKNFTPDYA
jgi:hypothetical protein